MKQIILFCIAFLCQSLAHSQDGIYLTLQDFKEGKLTEQTEDLRVFGAPGKSMISVRVNGEKKVYNSKDIWGYKKIRDGIPTDYRIISGNGHAIFSKGEVWVYTAAGDYFAVEDKKLVLKKMGREYPFVSKGVDGIPQVMTSFKNFVLFANPSQEYIDKVKKGYGGGLITEQMAYYNELKYANQQPAPTAKPH